MTKNNSNRLSVNFFLNFVKHVLLLLIFSICIYTLYLFPVVASITTNADALQLPTMLIDFQSNLGNLWGWKLPNAPYYFPDTIVFLTIGWIIKKPLTSIIIYSLIQNYFLFWSLRWLYCELGKRKTLVYDLCFLLTAVIFTYYHPEKFDNFPNLTILYSINLLSYHHFGTYVATVFSLAASCNYLRTDNLKNLIVCGLITLFTTASDLLFALYFTIPLLIVIGLFFKLKLVNSSRLKVIYLVLLTSSAIAYIFNKTIDPLSTKVKLTLDWDKISHSFSTFTNDVLVRMTIQEKLLILLIVVLPCAYFLFSSLINLYQFRKAKNSQTELKSIITLKLFILISAILNLISILGFGKYLDWGSMRYFLPIYYSPPIFGLLLLSLSIEKLNRKHLKIIQTTLAITIGTLIFMLVSSLEIKPVTEVFTPPNYVACFDSGAIAGLAGYWESKPIILFSQKQVQVATITDRGEPYYWNNNRYWYEDSWANPGNKPQFQFIFMHSLKPQAIIQRYGLPDRVETCNNSEIWWYDNPEQVYSQLMNHL